jgi:hypothetical protein
MNLYLVVLLVVLALLAVFVFRVFTRPQPRLTPLAAVAFAFVLAGVVFGETRLVGYGLMGVGVALAIADIVLQRRHA